MWNRLSRADGFLSPHGVPDEPVAEAQPGGRASANVIASHSAYGQRFKLALLCACPARDVPQTAKHPEAGQHDWRGNVIRQQSPLLVPEPFYDFVGAIVARAAKQIPVIERKRYQGQLPMDVQPELDKPHPWFDPTRGEP